MIKLIIKKELRDIIGSTKFAVSFGVCALLILLTFYIGAQNYHLHRDRYEAAKAENFRKMEGVTDWLRVNNHRIFLPPQPLELLVNGISNDIGRSITMAGRGELSAVDSRYNDDPIYAIFRFLDLSFIFQIVLSLFAILLAYDAVNGEKEQGTLRLSFSGPVPKDKFILSKLLGSFLALGVPLLIPILLGSLLLPAMGISLSGSEWIRLTLVILCGMLYFGAFLMLSILASVFTRRSANSFLIMLVIWIFSVFIIPRAAVLLAGRTVDVPSLDNLTYQKNHLRSQLWSEDTKKLNGFQPSKTGDPEGMINEFHEFMQDLSEKRDKKLQDFSNRLNEDRRNKQTQQERIAFSLARISPSAMFSLAASHLVGTALDLKQHFQSETSGYQQAYAQFMKEKTGMNLGSGMMVIKLTMDDEEEEKPIDPHELPVFEYHPQPISRSINDALFDIGGLAFLNILFFAVAFVGFLRYDVR